MSAHAPQIHRDAAAKDATRAASDEAAMSPWERLAIDWQDVHPTARSVLDDPFLWESSNDFSPNGLVPSGGSARKLRSRSAGRTARSG
jgi:hypothetical protein